MDYEKLKEVIAKQIKENGRREITGPVLQAVLMAMVDSLGEVYPHTYTDEEKAQARANIDALSNYDGEITKEKLSAEVQAILADVPNKQNITDASLATIAKTIVGAINEVYKGGLKDASIATSKIEDGAITEDKLASQSVTNAKIANASVSEEKITDNSVSTEKLKDGAITEPKLDTALLNIITSAVQPAELASAIATALASYVAKADIVDNTGSATDKVMSQHGVTEAINGVTNKVTELESEKVDKKIGRNLFNPNDPELLHGKFINSYGDIGSGSYVASGYIPVTAETRYYCSVEMEGFRFVCCYDSSKNVIASSIEDVRNFTTPVGCVYVRVSVYEKDFSYAQLATGYFAYTDYSDIGGYINDIEESIDSINDDLYYKDIPFTLNKIVSDNVNIGTVVNISLVNSNGNCVAIADLSGGEHIKVTGKRGSSSTVLLAFLDSDNKLIYKTEFTESSQLGIITPTTARKVIAHSQTAVEHKLMIASDTYTVVKIDSLGSDVDKIKETTKIIKNICNPSASGNVYGKYLNGENLLDGGYNTTDFMPVIPGETYYAYTLSEQKFSVRIIQFYTNTKKFTSTILSSVSTFVVPIDASYCRISFDDAYDFKDVSINNYGYTFVEYGYWNTLTNLIEADEFSLNLANPDDPEAREGYYFAYNYTLSENLDCTGYIPVEHNHTYKLFTNVNLSNNNLNMRYVAFFDANKDYINYVGDVESVTIENENVKYIIVSFYNRATGSQGDRERTISNIAVSDADVVYEWTPYALKLAPSLKVNMGVFGNSLVTKKYIDETMFLRGGNVLRGKKWVACGDSFTHGDFRNSLTNDFIFTEGLYAGEYKVYPFWIGRRNEMNVVNEAINGSTLTHISGSSIAFSDTRYQKIPSDADYITLKFGINDDSGHQNVPIGTINDTDNTTFYGAWNVVLDYLIRNHPQAKIGIIVTNGSNLDIVTATLAVAQKWGIPYLNEATDDKCSFMFRSNRENVDANIRSFRDETWVVNSSLNRHPNEKAHEFESTVVENWLRSL